MSTTVRTQDNCPRCGRLIALHADGTFYPHGPRAHRCPKSGQTADPTPSMSDEIADLLPATSYATVQVDQQGKRLTGLPERKDARRYITILVDINGRQVPTQAAREYETVDARTAAEHAAATAMTRDEWNNASMTETGDHETGGLWTFRPSTGSPVRVRVTLAPAEPAAVVARDEPLHPLTHPYRHGEVVHYVGPTPIPSGVARFQHLMKPGVAVLRVGEQFVTADIEDLRRAPANIAVELTPMDVARIFQALAIEAERIDQPRIDPGTLVHAVELRDRFAALHPDL